MDTQNGGELLTINEVSQKLKLHPKTTRDLYRRRKIPGLKLGHRTLRFNYPEVLAAIRQANDPAAAVCDPE